MRACVCVCVWAGVCVRVDEPAVSSSQAIMATYPPGEVIDQFRDRYMQLCQKPAGAVLSSFLRAFSSIAKLAVAA